MKKMIVIGAIVVATATAAYFAISAGCDCPLCSGSACCEQGTCSAK